MVKKIKYILLLTVIMAIGMYTKSLARIKTNDPTVESGGTVTITISSQEPVASGAVKIKSNNGLIFKSASGGTVNGDLVVFSGTNNVTSGIATYTFTAPEVAENTTYKVEFSSQDMADENGNSVASSSATATVIVKAKNQGGSNNNPSANEKATITKIVVGEKTYKNPKKDISLSVDNSVNSIKITPTVSNGESYTINGQKSNTVKLETGTNKVTIKLASGDSYILRISRLPKEEEVKPNQIQEPADKKEETPILKLLLTSLQIEGYELTPEFSSEIYSYKIEKQIPSNIDKLNVKCEPNIEGATIEIVGNTDLKDGENIISIVVKHGEETVAYQIVATKEAKEAIPVSVGNISRKEQNRIPRWDTKDKILITTFTSIITLMGIGYGIIEYRYTKEKESAEFDGNLALSTDDELNKTQVSQIFGEKSEDLNTYKYNTNDISNIEDNLKNNIDDYKSNFSNGIDGINNYRNDINSFEERQDIVKDETNNSDKYEKNIDNLKNNIDSFMNVDEDTKGKYDDFFGFYEKKPKSKTKSKGKHF